MSNKASLPVENLHMKKINIKLPLREIVFELRVQTTLFELLTNALGSMALAWGYFNGNYRVTLDGKTANYDSVVTILNNTISIV